MKPIRVVAAAFVVCTAVLWVAVRLPREMEPGVAADSEAQPTSRGAEVWKKSDGSSGVLAPPHDESVAALSEMRESASPPIQAMGAPSAATAPGRVVFRAIDRETRRPLKSFTVRLASETRFAEESHDGAADELALQLTPATYAGLVMSAGYESMELAPIGVESGETLRLAPVELLPGSSGILVTATGADVFHGLSVELRGVGRRPCGRCDDGDLATGARCPTCGFAKEETSLRIGPDGRVDFTGLAQGRFALRVVDALGRTIGDDRGVVLGFGEAAAVDFDVSRWRTIQVEVFDSDDVSLSSEWSRRLASPRGEVEVDIVSFEEAGATVIPIRFEVRRDGDLVAEASLIPPAPAEAVSFAIGGTSCGFGRHTAPRPTADRARVAGESLRREQPVPHFGPARVACELDRNGIAILAPVSTSQLELHLAAMDLVADAIVPPDRGPTHVRVHLRPSSESSASPAVTYRALERHR